MHRFFATQSLLVGQSVDLLPFLHQLHTVLRLQVGARILLLDDQGQAFLTEIQQLTRERAQGLVLSQQPVSHEPAVHLTLYQCSLKADKFEWVLQKGTELGVSHFVPVISERSVVRPAEALLKKYTRWQSILREAAEQCGRGRVPTLADPLNWITAVKHAEGVCLLPWEVQTSSALSLSHCLATQTELTTELIHVNLLIGPEGGITTAEADLACMAGWQVISLGPRILRAETAALASITLIMANLGELG